MFRPRFAGGSVTIALAAGLVCGSPVPGRAAVTFPTAQIPTDAHVLEITGYRAGAPPITITNGHEVRAVSSVIDGLRGAVPCSEDFDIGPPFVTFTFRASRHGRVLARAYEIRSAFHTNCIPLAFTTPGHKAIYLDDQNIVLPKTSAIIRRDINCGDPCQNEPSDT